MQFYIPLIKGSNQNYKNTLKIYMISLNFIYAYLT